MSLAVSDDSMTPGLASTYGPFPVLSDSSHSRDPHGLNAYLLHPDDNLWAYLEPVRAKPLTAPVEELPVLKKQRSIGLFKKSDKKGRRLTSSLAPEASSPALSSRSSSAVSSVSSVESDGVQTPKEEHGLGLAGVSGALAETKTRSKSWMGWMGKKRKESVTEPPVEASPPPTQAPALRSSHDEIQPIREMLSIHRQLRALTARKLASIQAPSPHPLADVFNQQLPYAPRRRERTFPASTNAPVVASETSERVKLLLKLVHLNASQGCPISGTLTRSPTPRTRQRQAGIAAFLHRPAFEERMVVYYPEHVSIVTPANPQNAIAEFEYSRHLYALAEATGGYFPAPSGPIDEIEAETVMLADEVDLEAERRTEVVAVDAVEAAETVRTVDAVDVSEPTKAPEPTASLAPATRERTPSPAKPARSSFIARPAPTWDDSSADEDDDDVSDDEPLATVARRNSLAFPPAPARMIPLKQAHPEAERLAREERREAERQRRYREEVEKTRARRESSRRGEVERKLGMDAAGRPSARPTTQPRSRTSSYHAPPPVASRRSQSFYELPRVYPMPVYPVAPPRPMSMAPPRAMSMVYPAYLPVPMYSRSRHSYPIQ